MLQLVKKLFFRLRRPAQGWTPTRKIIAQSLLVDSCLDTDFDHWFVLTDFFLCDLSMKLSLRTAVKFLLWIFELYFVMSQAKDGTIIVDNFSVCFFRLTLIETFFILSKSQRMRVETIICSCKWATFSRMFYIIMLNLQSILVCNYFILAFTLLIIFMQVLKFNPIFS